MSKTARTKTGEDRAAELFHRNEKELHGRVDRMFSKLMILQWLAGMAAALWISPQTWIGTQSQTHWHVWAAIFAGGVITALPVFLVWAYPGRALTRHCVAIAQTLFSSLFIHLTGGRIETHFHVFGSLAMLAFYRDWRVLATATFVVAMDHALRGLWWPQSVFGVMAASPWRWLEHAGWVIFEDIFLFLSIRQGTAEMHEGAVRRAALEASERRLAQAQHVAHLGSWEWDVMQNTMLWSEEQFRLVGLAPEGGTPSYELHLACIHPEDRDAVVAWTQTLLKTRDSAHINHRIVRPDGGVRILHSRADVMLDEGDAVVRVVGTSQDITDRERAEEDVRISEIKFRSVTQSVGEAIISADEAGAIMLWNRAAAQMFGYREEEAMGQPLTLIMPERYRAAHRAEIAKQQASPGPGGLAEPVELHGQRKDGTEFPIELTLSQWRTGAGAFQAGIVRDISHRKQAEETRRKANEELETRVTERTAELTQANTELQGEIAERKEADAKLKALHLQLLEISRQAGMAEVATSVLHNVGNVLNSVNVSCSTISATVRKSGCEHVARVAALLAERSGDLAGFFTSDPAGQKLPAFLGKLAERLRREQVSVLTELRQLSGDIDHIKEIVALQQNYGHVSALTEIVQVIDLVEDSLRMNSRALTRHDVQPIREYGEVPLLKVEKHKVMQILVNLIRNAKHACDESGRSDKTVALRVTPWLNGIRIAVVDNGIGIPAENLTRIFALGFTTRKDGHGYGLHSAAIAARELGGSLIALSDGLGAGATFILELPLEPPRAK